MLMGLNQRQLNASKKKWYYIVPAAVLGLCAVLSYFFLDDAIFQLVLKNRQQLRDIAWLGQLRIMGKTEGQLFVFCFWGWACRKSQAYHIQCICLGNLRDKHKYY